MISKEPVAVGAVTSIIMWITARYGIRLTGDQAAAVAGLVLVMVTPFIRRLVTSPATAEAEAKAAASAKTDQPQKRYQPRPAGPPPAG